MSIGEDNAVTPNCPSCGDTTPAGVVCLTCQPFPELQRCQVCARRGPRPTDQEPPDVPPIDPDAMQDNEPPPMPETLDGFKSTSFVSGHTIDEYRNGWSVMRRDRNGAVLSEKRFFKSRGHDRLDALEYAAQQHAKKNGGS